MNSNKYLLEGLREGKFKNISFLLGDVKSNFDIFNNFIDVSQYLMKQEKFIKFKDKYDNLNTSDMQKVNLEINFFKKNPQIFYDYIRQNNVLRYIMNKKPTKFHFFIKFLENKNILNFVYKINLDGLERKVGIKARNILYGYGNIDEAICVNCRKQFQIELLYQHINENKILYCNICSNACNYSNVYLDHLEKKDFYQKRLEMIHKTDLLFILGMPVIPNSYILNLVNSFDNKTTKILIYNENPKYSKETSNDPILKYNYFDYPSFNQDKFIEEILIQLGWINEFEELMKL